MSSLSSVSFPTLSSPLCSYPLHLPPFSRTPYDVNADERKFILSLEGRIDSIVVATKEAEEWQVLGHRGGMLDFINYENGEFFLEQGG